MKKLLILILFMVCLFAKVNINKATLKELDSLNGIGFKKAAAIIEFRKTHPFKKIEDIMKVKGIGFKTFEKIKGEIKVKDNN